MQLNWLFLVNSVLLGVGLAMDAFSVSLANGLTDHGMKPAKMLAVSGVYALFQWFMPLAGWILVHTAVEHFAILTGVVPLIALILLSWIGGKMIVEGVQEIRAEKKEKKSDKSADKAESESADKAEGDGRGSAHPLTIKLLLLQGVATSIDALSVGFTIADYGFWMALLAAVIIGLITWALCFGGLAVGKRFGVKLAGKATLVGGIILVGIGLEILISHLI